MLDICKQKLTLTNEKGEVGRYQVNGEFKKAEREKYINKK